MAAPGAVRGLNEGHAIGLGAHHCGQGAALALAEDNNDAALAGLMFGLAAGAELVGIEAAATRTDRSAIGLRPSELAEHGISLVFSTAIDFLEAQGAGCG